MSEPTASDWFNLSHFFSDELVQRWHEEDTVATGSLAEFMGLTDQEYAMWAEGRYHDLIASLREREA